MDTIYLDHENHEDVAFFFAILNQTELSNLRYLALDMSLFIDDIYVYAGDSENYQDKLLDGLDRVIKALPELEQLIEVHDVRVWGEHCIWRPHKESCKSRKGGRIEFFEELPVQLQKWELQVHQVLPSSSSYFTAWGIRNHKVVFGARESYTVAPHDPKYTLRSYHREFCHGVYGGRFRAYDDSDITDPPSWLESI
jgi:hypothetical protein